MYDRMFECIYLVLVIHGVIFCAPETGKIDLLRCKDYGMHTGNDIVHVHMTLTAFHSCIHTRVVDTDKTRWQWPLRWYDEDCLNGKDQAILSDREISQTDRDVMLCFCQLISAAN